MARVNGSTHKITIEDINGIVHQFNKFLSYKTERGKMRHHKAIIDMWLEDSNVRRIEIVNIGPEIINGKASY